MLFEGDADVNQQDGEGDSALHLAVHYNHMDCVKLLLQLGANVNLMNLKGNTPVRQPFRSTLRGQG